MYSLRKAARTKRSLKVARLYCPRPDGATSGETTPVEPGRKGDAAINARLHDANKSIGDT
jgi:hypothetical protein